MLTLPPSVRIFLAAGVTDLRKSFDGLEGIARHVIAEDPLSGHLFVFCNRRRNRLKMARLREMLDEPRDRILPASMIGKAVRYALGQWERLQVFLRDGRVEIDNNAVERAVRGVALGRKNWLFCGSKSGGKRAAVMYSLVQSCKELGVEPYAYFADVLERLPTTAVSAVCELTPRRWLAAQPTSPAE